jgi:N-acetylneuraminic acid mutarotase
MATNSGHGQQVATRAVSDQARASLKRLALTVIVGLFVVSFFVVHSTSVLAASGTWSLTGSLLQYREYQTATLLTNGQVLVAGGDQNNLYPKSMAEAELYNPSTGKWSTTSSLNHDRSEHAATLLQSGKVLVTGGWTEDGIGDQSTLASAELYDPSSGTWSATGSLNTARADFTATLLSNGLVLVAGGNTAYGGHATASAELYNPSTGTWTTTGSMTVTRAYHSATLLSNGKVLVAGGSDANGNFLASAELYNPSTGTWSATDSLKTAREIHTATLLQSGKVLVAGGYNSSFQTLASAELYNPSSGTWSTTGNLNTSRVSHTATLLQSGKVLVAGGETSSPYLHGITSAELYNPSTGTWSATGSLNYDRFNFTATLLNNGQVLAAAGIDAGGAMAELYTP